MGANYLLECFTSRLETRRRTRADVAGTGITSYVRKRIFIIYIIPRVFARKGGDNVEYLWSV